LIILLAVTLPHLGQGDFRRDTGRYAAVGLYLFNGGDLLAPHLNPDTPYFNKPPLPLLIHGFFLKTFGVHLAVARLPSILAALGVVLMSLMCVRKIGSRSEAVVSGAVLALTYEFFRRTREISLDFWQLFFVMCAIYFELCALRENRPVKLTWAGAFIGLALLCKPLVALGAIPVFAVWLVINRRFKWLLYLFLGALPLALLVAAPWHLYMSHRFGHAFWAQYFGHEVVDRARGRLMTNPFGYYFEQLAATYWPWLLGLLYAFYHRGRKLLELQRHGRDPFLLAGIWVVLILLGISCFPDKKPNYALPLYPMLSWMVAWGLCRVPWRKAREWYRRDFMWAKTSFAALGIILAVAPIRFQKPPAPEWKAVLRWFHEHEVAPDHIGCFALSSEDICYYYLQTGRWPATVHALNQKTGANPANIFILTDLSRADEKFAPLAVFKAGNLAIVPDGVIFDEPPPVQKSL
jgi:4-amino-4-deoxy-L-arabinose transferase-like glycosyltransferase